ncbi:aconitate hydratase AcnA [Geomonas sp. Red32]|uniref:aconitate hydratase AcnA n=1 Tax=Geomonas sp. Red32 TaxID=2912856 RepID=UPI00202CABD0|nr:aconitate hydratase AcnA [Geomonas sp. Red32]MCM0081449.1 aconitate hydratase AcnA [Geomonas sp. Red32]
MATNLLDSYQSTKSLAVDGKNYQYRSLNAFAQKAGIDIGRLPYSLKILLENLLRREDGVTVKSDDIEAVARWEAAATPDREIQFMPARILLQDFTGVPAVADLAAMRSALARLGGKASRINPLQPVDLVIDHSVQVDHYGTVSSVKTNSTLEFERNHERYQFLRWGQSAFRNFRVVPPETGICHQVNLEYLAQVVIRNETGGTTWLYPDTLVGTDSHTTMINGVGVVGWGVGGIEAEAAMLGQPCSMLIPQVVGFRLAGKLKPGATATDLVLTVTQMLRKKGVVGKFVEFFGPGAASLSIADRATISNMAPEYGATIGIFPVDEQTIAYLKMTGRGEVAPLVEAYFREQGLWPDPQRPEPLFSDTLDLDLGSVEPSLAGPSRPMDRVPLADVRGSFRRQLVTLLKSDAAKIDKETLDRWLGEGGSPVTVARELMEVHPDQDLGSLGHCAPVRQPDGVAYKLCHGSIVIAAITSCTNTSNPSVMMAAGVLARNAVRRGLQVRPWVKTSLAPGSKVVTDYLAAAGLIPYLEALRFHLVGYGCTTCIGNSGPLPEHIANAVTDGELAVAAVLSGNRNFEGRINSHVRANYLASPPLVVAYALAGNINIDLTREPLGTDANGQEIYLADIWPDDAEVASLVNTHVLPQSFSRNYADVFRGDEQWNRLTVPTGELYQFQPDSSYIKEPPFFLDLSPQPSAVGDIQGARVLAYLGDSITTDHISPAGSIAKDSPAGRYLVSLGIAPKDFNSYGARRGNHEVMVRGTFANIRIRNKLVPAQEGGVTKCFAGGDPQGEEMAIYDAAMRYAQAGTPLVVIAGKEYGTGSSRDWAAKGTKLLGVRAVIAESFERIHRSNLVGMGILPLQFLPGESAQSVGIAGTETFEIPGLESLSPGQQLQVKISANGTSSEFTVVVRIDTSNELDYYRHGGILPFVLRQFIR